VSIIIPKSGEPLEETVRKILSDHNGHLTTDNFEVRATDLSKIARPGSFDGSLISDDSITDQQLAPDSVTSSEIAADAVGSSEIAADAVGSSEIAADAVGASELAVLVDLTKPVVTSLPGSPTDGEVIFYQSSGMATDGLVWMLKYRAGSASTHKWECVGGSPLFIKDDGNRRTTSTTYVDVPSAGSPSITVPLAGDYDVWGGCSMASDGVDAGIFSVKRGASATSDTDNIAVGNMSSNGQGPGGGWGLRFAGLAASTVLKGQGRCTAGAGLGILFSQPRLYVLPVRVS
jgi:hypothetical protein